MSTLREQFIAHQRRWLAPYATGEWDAGPRAHAEAEHPYRTCFQRDRDRVVHCAAFRRLDYKTQVFVPHQGDHFRTRLTHTLEVAQVARNLARALRANEDLAETVALAHDLGHPPFGHAGEAVLAKLMVDHGHFEHNRQSLRIVDYLEHPYPDFRGLNLTRVVRECLAKHETRYDTPIDEQFDTALKAPLEGQLVDASDEIAYTSADLADALEAGWLTRERVAHLDLWARAWAMAEQRHADARPIHKEIRACKNVLAIMADDLLKTAVRRLAELNVRSVEDVRNAAARCVGFSDGLAPAVRQLQDFLLAEVYTNQASQAKDAQSERLIVDLFTLFTAEPTRLPPRYQQRIDSDGLHRVACDYIAGMTDRYCRKEHERLCS